MTTTSRLTVNNVAPSIAISGAASVNEGSSYTLTLGAVTDPGADTVTSYIVHWGDGNIDTYSTNGVKTHTYADGPPAHDHRRPGRRGRHLHRIAPRPAVDGQQRGPDDRHLGAASVNEGGSYTLTLGASPTRVPTRSAATSCTGVTGTRTPTCTNGAKTHIYADGPNRHAPSRSTSSTRTRPS